MIERVFGGLDHYARCAGVGCMEGARGYLGGIPVCVDHLRAAREHLAGLGQLPARTCRPFTPKDPTRSSIVYYGRCGSAIKIGSTYSPARRWQHLRAEHGAFHVLALEAGGQPVEFQRHAEFLDLRLGVSEWFREDPRLLKHIDQLCAANPGWRQLAEDAHVVACRTSKLKGRVHFS